MLDYKSIIIKRYALGMSYKELAEEFSASKSGINDFIRAFEKCEKLSYPLPVSCIIKLPKIAEAIPQSCSGKFPNNAPVFGASLSLLKQQI